MVGLNEGTRIHVRQGIEWTDAGGEVVLLDTQQNLFFGLDKVATTVWESLAQGFSLPDIAAEVTALYEVDAATAESDIVNFVHQLLERKLVVAV